MQTGVSWTDVSNYLFFTYICGNFLAMLFPNSYKIIVIWLVIMPSHPPFIYLTEKKKWTQKNTNCSSDLILTAHYYFFTPPPYNKVGTALLATGVRYASLS